MRGTPGPPSARSATKQRTGGRGRGPGCISAARRRRSSSSSRTVGRTGQITGKHAGHGRDSKGRRLRGGAGVRRGALRIRVQDVGNDVHDAVGQQDVRLDDARRVDKLAVALLAHQHARRLPGGVGGERVVARAVGQLRRRQHPARDDVVVHDAGEAGGVEAPERAADEAVRVVERRKDGHVPAHGEGGHQARGVQRAQERPGPEGLGGPGQLGRRHEQVVDDLDQAAGKGDVGLDQAAAAAAAAGEDDGVALAGDEHALAGGDVGQRRARQAAGLEVRRPVAQGGRGHGAVEDVVLQDGRRLVLVVGVPERLERRVGNVGNGLV